MKFSKPGQILAVATASLALATLFTACNPTDIDYVFVTSAKSNPGVIDVYGVDDQSGALTLTSGSPYSSGGNNPVAEAVTPNYQNLYVANEFDSSIVQFTVASNGALTKAATVTTPGTYPVSLAVNAAGTLLFAVDSFQAISGCSSTNPCSGALVVYPISSSGALGTPVANGSLAYWPLTLSSGDVFTPTGVNALANGNSVYVCGYDTTGALGYVFGFSVASNGGLTALTGSPYLAGVKPSALSSTPTSRYLYVTDFSQNQLIGYNVQSGGELVAQLNSPYRTGNEPTAITIDPRGLFLYVTNELDNTVSAYAINISTGSPTAAVNTSGSLTNNTDTSPVAIVVEPSLGRFLFTANFLGNSVSGFQLNPSTGVLNGTINTPYPSAGSPTAIVAVIHGNHALQVDQP